VSSPSIQTIEIGFSPREPHTVAQKNNNNASKKKTTSKGVIVNGFHPVLKRTQYAGTHRKGSSAATPRITWTATNGD
jgi:hypothetical protein